MVVLILVVFVLVGLGMVGGAANAAKAGVEADRRKQMQKSMRQIQRGMYR